MAAITEKTRGNQVVSFKFTSCIGRDAQGKQKDKTAVWKPPEGITINKARKLAEAEACRWEQEIKSNGAPAPQGEYIKAPAPQTPLEAPPAAEDIPEEETFRYFAEQVWMPLKVIAGGARPSTIAMYRFMMRVSLPRSYRLIPATKRRCPFGISMGRLWRSTRRAVVRV